MAFSLSWKTKLRLTQVFFQGKTESLTHSVPLKGVLSFRSSPHFPTLAMYLGGGPVSLLASISYNCLSWNKYSIVETLRAGNWGGAGLWMLSYPVVFNSISLAIVEPQWQALLSGVLWEGVSSSPHLLSYRVHAVQRNVKWRIFLWKNNRNGMSLG